MKRTTLVIVALLALRYVALRRQEQRRRDGGRFMPFGGFPTWQGVPDEIFSYTYTNIFSRPATGATERLVPQEPDTVRLSGVVGRLK